MPSNAPAPLAQLLALPIQQGGTCLQTSAVNLPPPISALLIQRDVLPLQTSVVGAAAPPHWLYFLIQGQWGPPPPPSAMRAHNPLLSTFIHQ